MEMKISFSKMFKAREGSTFLPPFPGCMLKAGTVQSAWPGQTRPLGYRLKSEKLIKSLNVAAFSVFSSKM